MSIDDRINEVIETKDFNEVNALLKKGWRLLDVLKQGDSHNQYPLYIVGKTQTVVLDELIEEFNKEESGSE